ncbi:uroporphyrinogen-III C-methyltransferase [Labilibaculum sp. DW002]|uniref:uroporphyrinogen-III C-methyltransferase n=1 Tax=Paralabilibaculum antarcticum TaxID=2912572 RepID=A0ABT5VQ70_9BACT|nr:uroporphyrinogen-III C-methyltransferase [Labilibaculum sp. DW002]MDE5417581.1 uroporphyrinogen-III C-methyltransferase [Labilibaculum sp. DW002]
MEAKTNKYDKPVLTLVGAGPGDPELISIKGANALKRAKVVLYDALVNPEILEYAPKNSLKVYVGKRANNHSHTQDEINKLIVDYSYKYGNVVRLKGGDPFIFGRGKEEAEYAELHGIKVAVIPGLSSATTLPALKGISLTSRGISESFWVLSGTTQNNQLASDIKLAAKSSATIVILMGRNKLSEIVEIFKNNNKSGVPVAVIQNGSLANEKTAISTIENIEKLVEQKNVGTPSIIIIGEVVRQHTEYVCEYLHSNLLQNQIKENETSHV